MGVVVCRICYGSKVNCVWNDVLGIYVLLEVICVVVVIVEIGGLLWWFKCFKVIRCCSLVSMLLEFYGVWLWLMVFLLWG